MRIAFIAAATLLLAACNNPKTETATNIVTTTPPTAQPIPFAGYWVNKSYYDTLLLTGSQRAAQGGSIILIIPDSTGRPVMQGWGFHEGSSDFTVYKNEETYTLYNTSDDTLVNTGSILNQLPDGTLDFAGTTFVKIAGTGNDFEFPVVEEILFKGRYTNAAGDNIELTSNQGINGWPLFDHYLVVNDYYDRGMQVDQLSLKRDGSKEAELLGFKFTGDTLNLYSINCIHEDEDGECAEVDFGDLKYSLWKVK